MILVLLVFIEVLLFTWKLDWILNFSSFLQYLATTHLMFPIFFHPSELESLRTKTEFGIVALESLRTKIALFLKPCKLKLNDLINFREIATTAHI